MIAAATHALPRVLRIRLTLSTRIFPLLVAWTLWDVTQRSGVNLELWAVTPQQAEWIAINYVALLVIVAALPNQIWLHTVGAPLAVIVFGSRALGFLHLINGPNPRPDLRPAVAERVVLLLAVVLFHMTGAQRAILHQQQNDPPPNP